MKVLYLVLPLLSSLVIAQSLIDDDCECPQIKCRATNAIESCRCINKAELACKIKCPNYIPTRWRSCPLPQQEVTTSISTPPASTSTVALPLPTDPILGFPVPILPVPRPTPLVLPFPDLPLVPGCECEQTMCIMSFPEGCHCQWNVKKDCYNKCGGTSPGINTCPALPAPVPPKPTPPKPVPQVLPFPDLPLVPGCECEETMCTMSFPEGCHCQWNVKKDCYNKCGGTSPGINTCPALPAPVPPKPTPPKPVPQVLPFPDLPQVPGCECEETMCIMSFPEGCHCQWNVKKDCYNKCGGTSPGINTCPDLTGTVPPNPTPPKPIPQVLPLPDLPQVPGCECEEMMCVQSYPESCHCAWGIAKNCYDKCGGKSPGINTCPSKNSFGGGSYGDGPVKRVAAPEPQTSTKPIPANTAEIVSGLIGALKPKACNYEERFCTMQWPQSCNCANANKRDRYMKCGGAYPVYQACTSLKPTTIKTITKTVTKTITPTPTPTGDSHKVQICGGGRANQNQACPTGYTCVNDPYVKQSCGLECDRTGICVKEQLCGGFAGFPCTTPGQVCLDDPRDDCSPRTGGADCGGLCFWPPSLREKA